MDFANALALTMRGDRFGLLETASDRAADVFARAAGAWRDADSELVDRVEDG
ncbi:hypothetical protein [Natronococcus wangiae]|uniref:hypothetical protein n=1 Tax=Natronococcus wangiae TaxID=3068275 RepID=UPI00273E7170|nr:hypothetical protein [Natronococcus sp. AD5]